MSPNSRGYTSDLTGKQWALIEPLIPVYEWGRPRTLNMRRVVDGNLVSIHRLLKRLAPAD